MALYRDLTGKIRVVISRDELMDLLQNWREKSETKQLIAKLNAERCQWIDKLVAEYGPRRR